MTPKLWTTCAKQASLLGITGLFLCVFRGAGSPVKLKKIFSLLYLNGLILNTQEWGVYYVVVGGDRVPAGQLEGIFDVFPGLTLHPIPVKRDKTFSLRLPYEPVEVVKNWGAREWALKSSSRKPRKELARSSANGQKMQEEICPSPRF